jgi:hypothetical protein
MCSRAHFLVLTFIASSSKELEATESELTASVEEANSTKAANERLRQDNASLRDELARQEEHVETMDEEKSEKTDMLAKLRSANASLQTEVNFLSLCTLPRVLHTSSCTAHFLVYCTLPRVLHTSSCTEHLACRWLRRTNDY